MVDEKRETSCCLRELFDRFHVLFELLELEIRLVYAVHPSFGEFKERELLVLICFEMSFDLVELIVEVDVLVEVLVCIEEIDE